MTTTSFRTDDAVEEAIARLQTEYQASRSETIRRAILVALKQAEREALRRECAELMADEADVAESKALAAEMEALRAW